MSVTPDVLQSVATIRIKTPIQLIQAGEALGNAWFRGHGSAEWPLQSTLERDADRFSVPSQGLLERETVMLRLFRERAHLYDQNFVEPRSRFEWYSLIRHYGGPSRLLDITSSYLVAAYFALSDSPRGTDAAVWAFCGCTANSMNCDLDVMFSDNAIERVVIAKPDRLNARINSQSGGFFVPSSVAVSLEQQISKTFETNFNAVSKYRTARKIASATNHRIWKLVIPHSEHNELLRFLSRCNVRAYSVFPGMEGLAASLQEMMRAYK